MGYDVCRLECVKFPYHGTTCLRIVLIDYANRHVHRFAIGHQGGEEDDDYQWEHYCAEPVYGISPHDVQFAYKDALDAFYDIYGVHAVDCRICDFCISFGEFSLNAFSILFYY